MIFHLDAPKKHRTWGWLVPKGWNHGITGYFSWSGYAGHRSHVVTSSPYLSAVEHRIIVDILSSLNPSSASQAACKTGPREVLVDTWYDSQASSDIEKAYIHKPLPIVFF